MQTITRTTFTTVKTEGALLPADLLQRIAEGKVKEGLRPEEYHLFAGERLNEAINRAWSRCLSAWSSFNQQRERLPTTETGTTLTRERWLLILFQELGYGRLQTTRGLEIEGITYPISHIWGCTPLHLVTFRQSLDRSSEVGTAVKRTPHSLVQEFINRSPDHLWAFVTNGLQLRLLRDNASFTRSAYVEFDLEGMMTGEHYADFTLLWLVCHQSRVETPLGEKATACWLERWSRQAAEEGTRARERLRDGVQEAIEVLGRGFLAHPNNRSLKEALRRGDLSTNDYNRQLLRLVYRLIFLFVAEDRDLLLLPAAEAATRQCYLDYYSVRRLRTLAEKMRGGPHGDLYRRLRLLFQLLRGGYPTLGIPGLGSFLFSERATPALDGLELANHALLDAIRELAFTVEQSVRRPVDYRNLGSEELGSIYESLLELHPQLNVDAATFELKAAAGSVRKTSGSYYTPPDLVNCLLDSALEPVVAERLAHCPSKAQPNEDKRTPQERAILSIKVLDPAAGSGHFLIGAARRLARHLARVQTGDAEPAPEAIRHALREVVRHCIYGVDVNELSVELCKVSLWMETLEPGKPLGFLDKNIQCGNSLIGVTPGLNINEIPDDAFQPVTGDDKATATALRRRNRREREGQLGFRYKAATVDTAEAMICPDILTEDDLQQVAAREYAYHECRHSDKYQQARLEYDLWTSAFFWPIPAVDADTMPAPTQQSLIELRAGHVLDGDLADGVRDLARRHQFFHWSLSFSDVFNKGGFDVVLSNPPWERIKLQEKEWFEAHAPEIANAPNADARRRLINNLITEDPTLYTAFHDRKAGIENESHFIRTSNVYPLCGRGDVNTYAIFAELSRQVLSDRGRIGIIVPTGIATDDTTKFYFQDIMKTGTLVCLFSFENEEFLFPGVHHSTKFSLMTLSGISLPSNDVDFLFFARQVSHLSDASCHFSLTTQEIELINPNTLTAPIFRYRRDAEITKSIYQRIPVLVNEKVEDGNPWHVEFNRMFDMANDSEKFLDSQYLESLGHRPEKTRFLNGTKNLVPLFEAKMFHFFDHRFGTYQGQTLSQAAQGKLPELMNQQHEDSSYYNVPRYWLEKQHVTERLVNRSTPEWLLVFRKVARSTDQRTLISAIIPKTAVADTAPIIVSEISESRLLCCLLANFNSYICDYVCRQKIGGTAINHFLLKQIAVVPPQQYSIDVIHEIVNRVLELTYTAWDMEPFARDCGYTGPPFRWDEERRILLRCELDAAYFHLYGIERDDVDYIMETFPIVKRKDVDKYGEYRTKRVILEIYDEMAIAMRTGVNYQTRLDPPPADVRVAHTCQKSG